MDGCFGLIKQKYRRSDSDSIDHLVRVVNESASCNHAEVYHASDGSSNWKWRNWDVFLAEHFKPLLLYLPVNHSA